MGQSVPAQKFFLSNWLAYRKSTSYLPEEESFHHGGGRQEPPPGPAIRIESRQDGDSACLGSVCRTTARPQGIAYPLPGSGEAEGRNVAACVPVNSPTRPRGRCCLTVQRCRRRACLSPGNVRIRSASRKRLSHGWRASRERPESRQSEAVQDARCGISGDGTAASWPQCDKEVLVNEDKPVGPARRQGVLHRRERAAAQG